MQQPGIPVQPVGIPLHYALEAPKLKQTWVQKEGTITEFFKDFVSQAAEQFMHSQLDKLTNDIHHRVIHGVDADSKRLVFYCEFSQVLAHRNINGWPIYV